jgi:hypothetical protein
VCKQKFEPRFNTIQPTCGIACAIIDAQSKQAKAYRKETRELKKKAKTRGDWLKEAQTVFNQYIRLRDAEKPCISCGRYHEGQYHAGHYKTVGAHPELRFHEMNCFRQCSPCNNHLSGNIIEYRKTLLELIGEKSLNWLEGNHAPQKLTIEDIQDIKKHYKEKIKWLEAQK